MLKLKEKRAYDLADPADGYRVYVDRLWPRGLSRVTFHYDLWAKQVTPSAQLRHWYHEDPANRWDEFRQRYLAELEANPAADELRLTLSHHPVATLLYSSYEPQKNNATVLREFLLK